MTVLWPREFHVVAVPADRPAQWVRRNPVVPFAASPKAGILIEVNADQPPDTVTTDIQHRLGAHRT